jgi:transketolase
LPKPRSTNERPTLIICKTHIGKGSPNRANTAKAHGEPLGAEEIKLTREALGWPHAPFRHSQDVYADWDAKAAGKAAEKAWNDKFAAYKTAHPRAGQRAGAPHEGRAAQFAQTVWTPWWPHTPRPKPWPAARPANWRWKPSPLPCPSCWAARPT